MDILEAFVLDGKNHDINVLWEEEKPLFRASEIGDILEMTNIRMTLGNFDTDEKVVKNVYTPGGTQDVLFLTEAGIYRLLMLSRKPIARPFQKWITKVLISIREQGKYELKKELERSQALMEEAKIFMIDRDNIVHESLVNANKQKHVVYIGVIKMHDNKKLVKLGSTDDIARRSTELADFFGSFKLVKVLECGYTHRLFESFLLSHKEVDKYKYKDIIHDGKKSTETVLVDDAQLEKIINIATHNVYKFKNQSRAEHEIDMQRIRLAQEKIQLEKEQLELEKQRLILVAEKYQLARETEQSSGIENVEELFDTDVDPITLFADARRYTQSKGEKVQRYASDGKTLIQTYESLVYVIRDASINAPSRLMLKNAIKQKSIYAGFRWAFLARELPDDTKQDIGETSDKTTDVKKGYVAMLHLDKSRIVEVFCDQKAAGESRNFKSGTNISRAIHEGTLSSGHYWKMWNDCAQELQDEYLTRVPLPNPRAVKNSTAVEKLHPITLQVVKRYDSVADVIKDHPFSRVSLFNTIKSGIIAKGYRWRLVA